MQQHDQPLLSSSLDGTGERKPRDNSLGWLIVFTSAALTLASATSRTHASSARPIPASSGAVEPAGPECGPSCPKKRTPAAS